MSDSTWGLEDFSTYISRRENRGVLLDKLRARYDAAVAEAKDKQKRANDEARQHRLDAEAKAEREAAEKRRAEDVRKREQAAEQMKANARRDFMHNPAASEADFEAAWPDMKRKMLADEALRLDVAARANASRAYKSL